MRWNKENSQKLLIAALLCITASALCVTAWALFFRSPQPVLAPDYAPVATEGRAEPIPGDSGNAESAAPGSGSVSLSYSAEVSVDLGRDSATLFFANPGKSNQDMVVQIVIRDVVIFQSGRLTPGNQLTQLDLTEEATGMLAPGGYDGSFLVFYYDAQTGEKAVVNTEIPIRLTVTE